MSGDVRLTDAPFAPEAEIGAFARAHQAAGGVVSFVGQVRVDSLNQGVGGPAVEALELRHYPPLTLPGMQALADAALARWSLIGLLMVHRTGVMLPGDAIVLVCAAARHRRDAFAAADFANGAGLNRVTKIMRICVAGTLEPAEPGPRTYPGIRPFRSVNTASSRPAMPSTSSRAAARAMATGREGARPSALWAFPSEMAWARRSSI